MADSEQPTTTAPVATSGDRQVSRWTVFWWAVVGAAGVTAVAIALPAVYVPTEAGRRCAERCCPMTRQALRIQEHLALIIRG